MGPHPENVPYFCPCGMIYLKYRSLATHLGRNPDCFAADVARSRKLDAEVGAIIRGDTEPETAVRLRDLERLEDVAAARAAKSRQLRPTRATHQKYA